MAAPLGRDIIVVGASAGGIRALREVLSALPQSFPAAIFAVLHMSPSSPDVLPRILDRAGPLPVLRAKHGASIRRGTVTVAPADHHLILTGHGVRLSHGPRENRHRPSIDVLFRSAAVAYGSRVIGVILTGMLDDGAAGLWAIKRRDGLAIVQDPTDAEYPDMPRNALQFTRVDACVPLADIASRLAQFVQEPIETPVEPAPEPMQSEVRMASEENGTTTGIDEMDKIGERTPLTCPECGGALWEMNNQGGLSRYRCHVGHAYSMQTLEAEQGIRVEAALWAALRGLEEEVRIAERMAHAATTRGERGRAQYHDDRAVVGARHAQVLREVLEQGAERAGRADEPAAQGTG